MKNLAITLAAAVVDQVDRPDRCRGIDVRSERRREKSGQLSDLVRSIAKARRRETLRFTCSVIGALALLFAFILVLHLSL